MNLDRWLKAELVAASRDDADLLRELAVDMLGVVATDPEQPRAWECVKACELAIVTYHGLAGDWTTKAALAAVKDQDAQTKLKAHGALAAGRADAKAAWTRSVQDILLATRALRHLGEQTAARGAGNVIQMRRRA